MKKIFLFTLLLLFSIITFAEAKINLKEYPANRGEYYRISRKERYSLLDSGKLFTWKKDDRGKGTYIPLKDIKNSDGKAIDIKKYFDLYELDLDGDGIKEVCVIPGNMPVYEDDEKTSDEWFSESYYYRATVLKKSGNGYRPFYVATIEGDYASVLDIRDLNGDGITDLLLSSGAGASSYNDIVEICYFDKNGKTVKSQVFLQWVLLYDFNSDSIYELVVSFPEGCNSAHAYWASWQDIWEWNGKKYVLASEKYPEYYDLVYIPQKIESMIDFGDMASAVTDRVPLIKKAWKIIIKAGLYEIIDARTAGIENKKGLDALNKGDREEALKHFKKAVTLSPQEPEFMNNLGFTYEDSRKYEKAVDCYLNTLARDPARSVAWYNMACSKAVIGKKDQAVMCFYNYMRFATPSAKAEEAVKYLAKNARSDKVRAAAKEALKNYQKGEQ